MEPFKPSRDDGRSDKQVVLDLVRTKKRGDFIPYEEFVDALAEGTDRDIERHHAQVAVRSAERTLLEDHQMVLKNVRGQGYLVAQPNGFRDFVVDKRDRTKKLMVRGQRAIEYAPYGDMAPATRRDMDELQAQVTIAFAGLEHVEGRQKRQEEAIRLLTRRVDRIEGRPPDIEGEATS